ncbi:MAG: hypothetical protein LBQ42_10425 [Synergistaceae bacterium]|jgi:prophage antirepressor-like protein|nr:hypothetical protein [Synergistaceae bacterium]
MDSCLQVFEFEKVRIVLVDSEPMFVCEDVVEAIGGIWKGDAGSIAHVPEEWKGVCSVQTLGGIQQVTGFREQGVYFYLAGPTNQPRCLFRSTLPEKYCPLSENTEFT